MSENEVRIAARVMRFAPMFSYQRAGLDIIAMYAALGTNPSADLIASCIYMIRNCPGLEPYLAEFVPALFDAYEVGDQDIVIVLIERFCQKLGLLN